MILIDRHKKQAHTGSQNIRNIIQSYDPPVAKRAFLQNPPFIVDFSSYYKPSFRWGISSGTLNRWMTPLRVRSHSTPTIMNPMNSYLSTNITHISPYYIPLHPHSH